MPAANQPFNPFNRQVVTKAVEQFGTPQYLYDEATIRTRCQDLTKHIPGEIHYAIKANPNLEILKIIRDCGVDVEAVSVGEVNRALKSGFKPKQIVFTCGYVAAEELQEIVRRGITIHADSLNQLEQICQAGPASKAVSVRLNHGVGGGHHEHVFTGGPDSKFGIEPGQLAEAQAIARKHDVELTGLHQHIGSEILDPKLFGQALDALLATSRQVENLELLDFGGGFGVPYRPGESRLDLSALGPMIAKKLDAAFKDRPKRPRVAFEPGRYPVAEAGVLNAQVTDIKRTSHHTFVGLDTGFNHSPRTMMYRAYHHIVNVTHPDAPLEPVVVVGNVCESGDRFTMAEGDTGYERKLPRFEVGDIVSLLTAGAYVETMASEYNSRPKPPAILCRADGRLDQIS